MRRIVDAFAEYERALIRARTQAALGLVGELGQWGLEQRAPRDVGV